MRDWAEVLVRSLVSFLTSKVSYIITLIFSRGFVSITTIFKPTLFGIVLVLSVLYYYFVVVG